MSNAAQGLGVLFVRRLACLSSGTMVLEEGIEPTRC
jgi:hypothetical protein